MDYIPGKSNGATCEQREALFNAAVMEKGCLTLMITFASLHLIFAA